MKIPDNQYNNIQEAIVEMISWVEPDIGDDDEDDVNEGNTYNITPEIVNQLEEYDIDYDELEALISVYIDSLIKQQHEDITKQEFSDPLLDLLDQHSIVKISDLTPHFQDEGSVELVASFTDYLEDLTEAWLRVASEAEIEAIAHDSVRAFIPLDE
jgi:hypothetical protein